MTKHGLPRTCPHCGSSELRFARKGEFPLHYIVLRKFLACKTCGNVFQPSSALTSALLLILLGGPASVGIAATLFSRPSPLKVAIYGPALLFSVAMFYEGCRVLMYWRGRRRQERETR